MAKIIGLTGSFGTGKTLVASEFRSLGARVLDADKIAHDVIRAGTGAYRKIVTVFGPGILGKGRAISRKKLAAVVFADKKKLGLLNGIIHPEVIAEIKEGIRKFSRRGVVVIDAPLLVEAGLVGLVDILVVVRCSRKRQIERCMDKFNMEKNDVLKRIRGQVSLGKKVAMADFVINNDKSKNETLKQVRAIWREITWK